MWTGISDSVETIRYTQFITVTKPNSLFKFSSAHKHFSVQEKNKIKQPKKFMYYCYVITVVK